SDAARALRTKDALKAARRRTKIIPALGGRSLTQVREQRRSDLAFDQRVFNRPRLARLELDDPLYFAADERCDWNAVAVQHAVVRERRYFGSGHDEPDEIQRIRPTDRHQRFGGRCASRLAQQPHRLRQGELLTGDIRHKTATANVAARFKPAQNAQQLAPWWQPRRLTLQHAPANDAG